MNDTYKFSNVPTAPHITTVADIFHKLVGSAPWHEGDKVAAQQVLTDEFGHPTPFKELSLAAATAVQQNEDLKKQIAELERKAEEREKAFNDRLDKLIAAFAAKQGTAEVPIGNPSGTNPTAEVQRIQAVQDANTTAQEQTVQEAQSDYAKWKAEQDAKKEQQQ